MAEFEHVPDQVGAVILINGQVVGIERAPSCVYWKAVWPRLIRDCYGSLALQLINSQSQPLPPTTRVPLSTNISSLDELADALARAAAEERRRAVQGLGVLLHKSIRLQIDGNLDGLTLATLSENAFIGQVIRDLTRVVYVSLIASQTSRLRQRRASVASA